MMTESQMRFRHLFFAWNNHMAPYRARLAAILLLPDLRYLAGDFEGYCFAVGVCNHHLGFAGATGADGYRKSGTVCVVRRNLFHDVNLDGMECEYLQRKEDLVSTSYSFAIVGIDKLPCVGRLTRDLLDRKCKLIDTLGE